MENSAAELARELFQSSGYYCAESVLLALAEQQGIHSDLLPRIATPFCSGFSRSGGTCGAVSGAVMGIGLALGRMHPAQSVDPAYTATTVFVQRFKERFGALTCLDLAGCHLGTPEGQAQFQAGQVIQRCYEYVAGAAEIAARVIAEANISLLTGG